MLRIREIILENFKSYLGKQTIGPFHEKFTAVIGPNGSGKSNLIESLLFVFGKRARWLRAQQLHQLIHSSSKAKKASVEVIFEEFNGGQVGRFRIKRVVYHTSISHYEIDGVEATQDQVITVLKQKGIDLQNNRFLVLQGEVEQIFLMKPKSGDREQPGLLEYLEEVIGTMELKESMDEKNTEIEKLEEKRYEYGERVTLARNTLEQIYPVVRQSLMNVASRIHIMIFKNVQQQLVIYKFSSKIAEYECNIDNLSDQLRLQEEERQKIIIKRDQCQQKVDQYKYNKRDREGKLAKVSFDLQTNSERSNKLQEEAAQLEIFQEKIDRKLRETLNELELLNADRDEMLRVKPDKQANLLKLQKQKDILEEQHQQNTLKVSTQLTDLYKRKSDLEASLHPFQNELAQLDTKMLGLKNDLESLTIDEKPIKHELDELQRKMHTLEKQLHEITKITEKFSEIFKKMTDNKQTLQKDINGYNQEVEKKVQSINEITQSLDSNQQANLEQNSRLQLVSEIIKASRKKLIPDVSGRLGDLATIDTQYDTAITVACPALDYIVVSTSEDAQKCIEYLKQQKLGRCTFMPIDRTPQEIALHMNRSFVPPPYSQRLFDLLVLKDDKFRPVFFNVLRDTLVTDNIDMANEIAFGQVRRRVVTRDGKLIEPNGVMSGGPKPRKGGMSSKFKSELSNEEILNLNKEKQVLSQQISEIKQLIEKKESAFQELLQDEHQAKSRYKQKLVDLEIVKDSIKENSERTQHLQEQMRLFQKNQTEREELEQKITRMQMKIDKLRQRMEVDSKELVDIEAQIKVFGNVSSQEQLQKLTKQFEEMEREFQKLQAQLLATDKRLTILKKSKEEDEQSLKEVSNNQEKNQKSKQELDQSSYQLVIEETRLKQSLQELGLEEKQIYSDLKKAQTEFKDAQELVIQTENELNQLETEKAIHQKQQLQEKAKLEDQHKEYREFLRQYDFQVLQDIQEDDLSLKALFSRCFFKQRTKYHQIFREQFIPFSNEIFPEQILDSLQFLSQEQLSGISKETFGELQVVDEPIDQTLIMEYNLRSNEYEKKLGLLESAQKRYDQLKQEFDGLRSERKQKFEAGFRTIAKKLSEIYMDLSNGGNAEIEILDTLDPFSEGIQFQVRPKNKTWKQLHKLSGGEKTLSSLSLLLALHYFRPTPLYFFDEIDAALDFKNVGIVAQHIKQQSAQFIVISLRTNMFEVADKIIGIYKVDEGTLTLSLDPQEAIKESQRQ